MPNFSKPFLVETDASGKCISDLLMQRGHPIAYISRYLAPRHQAMSVYERAISSHICCYKMVTLPLEESIYCQDRSKSIEALVGTTNSTDFQIVGIFKLMAFDLLSIKRELKIKLMMHCLGNLTLNY